MRDIIIDVISQTGNLTLNEILLRISVAAVLSVVIYMSYWYTHVGSAYSKKFNASLMSLTILTATVMTVIGNNIALSLGMAGALSIVRFRTAVKDSRDTIYIFWAVIIGLCAGVGDFATALIGSGIVFIVLLIMGRVRNENRIILVIRGHKSLESEIEKTVFNHFKMKPTLRVKNTTPESVEFIFEMSRKTYQLTYKNEETITELLYEKGDIEYINVITQNDEISG